MTVHLEGVCRTWMSLAARGRDPAAAPVTIINRRSLHQIIIYTAIGDIGDMSGGYIEAETRTAADLIRGGVHFGDDAEGDVELFECLWQSMPRPSASHCCLQDHSIVGQSHVPMQRGHSTYTSHSWPLGGVRSDE